MFKCKECSQLFDSRSSYIDHSDTCQPDAPKSQTKERAMKVALEKLMTRCSQLKTDLKKQAARANAAKEERDSYQIYYTGQIESLLSERDVLSDRLEILENENKYLKSHKTVEIKPDTLTNQVNALNAKLTAHETDTNNLKTNFSKQLEKQASLYQTRIDLLNQSLTDTKSEDYTKIIQKNNQLQHIMADKVRSDEALVKTKAEMTAQIKKLTDDLALTTAQSRIDVENAVKNRNNTVSSIQKEFIKMETSLRQEIETLKSSTQNTGYLSNTTQLQPNTALFWDQFRIQCETADSTRSNNK